MRLNPARFTPRGIVDPERLQVEPVEDSLHRPDEAEKVLEEKTVNLQRGETAIKVHLGFEPQVSIARNQTQVLSQVCRRPGRRGMSRRLCDSARP